VEINREKDSKEQEVRYEIRNDGWEFITKTKKEGMTMKPIIINMNEMSDSREVYESKPNRALPAFLYTCLALVIVAVVWMCLGKIDIAVNANGMLRPGGTVNTVVNAVGGEVLSVHAEDGSLVEAGELLYVVEHEELLAQKAFYEEKAAFYKQCLEETQAGDSYNELLSEVEFQLSAINRSIEKCYVKAPCDGVVNMLQEPVVGNQMSAGVEVCSILPPEETGYKCLIYVNNADVAGLEPGMQVRLNVYSFPNTEYGYVYGTLTKVSNDIRVDAQSGMAYYLAEASVDAESFVDENGVPVSLKAGMACEAKIITGEEKIMTFVLEKLNLLAVN